MEPLRQCKCGTVAYTDEDLELFEKRSNGLHGRGNRCKLCRNVYGVQSGHNKGRNVQDRYGITRHEYLDIMQGHTNCECCGKETEELCYDHDHVTMDFRGRLCHSCNRGIGLLGDNKEGLQRALDYITGNSPHNSYVST